MPRGLLYSIVLLGCGGVGKSALTIQLVNNKFLNEYDPTIEDSYRIQQCVDNEPCILDIMDTAGQEELGVMREQYMRSGEGFLLVFDLTNSRSFNDLKKIYESLKLVRENEDKLPIILIGNKCDLIDKRTIQKSVVENFANEICATYFETSAKNRINIEESFFEIIRLIRSLEALKTLSTSTSSSSEDIKTFKKTKKKLCLIM
eukprot:TRINITY_DN315_c1_g1_i1.p1 TRINITY_DN315_c1_g1~~TRINITY_DN315_c1_g1_i1.p1  ORF type:complete len:203 (-),score=61.96 TRINITY_DN315_c1_g1_i1:139-747(-)